MSEYFIVDRIEGEKIIIESQSGELSIITKEDTNGIIKESDVLFKKGNKFVVNNEKTENRKANIKNLMKGMWQ